MRGCLRISGFGQMGGFNFPMFVLFIAATIAVAVPLWYWTGLPKWAALLLAPFAGFIVLFVIFQIPELLERKQKSANSLPGGDAEADDGLAKKAGFSMPKKPEGLLCPSCGSEDIAVILYGLLAITEELEKAIADQEVTLGGCCVDDDSPRWVCNACRCKFGEPGPEAA